MANQICILCELDARMNLLIIDSIISLAGSKHEIKELKVEYDSDQSHSKINP
jgi:hypothetical protein